MNAWLREEGNRRYAEWLDQHPGHVLASVVRFHHGRGLILTGSHAPGRKILRSLIESPAAGSLRDDALFWEGDAYQQEKRMADATRSFRVLLRDYPWSNNASKIRGGFQPAGAELKPAGSDRPPADQQGGTSGRIGKTHHSTCGASCPVNESAGASHAGSSHG